MRQMLGKKGEKKKGGGGGGVRKLHIACVATTGQNDFTALLCSSVLAQALWASVIGHPPTSCSWQVNLGSRSLSQTI